MSEIIKTKNVISGLRCCLEYHDCITCPYSKFSGKDCQKRLLKNAEILLMTRQYDTAEIVKKLTRM